MRRRTTAQRTGASPAGARARWFTSAKQVGWGRHRRDKIRQESCRVIILPILAAIAVTPATLPAALKAAQPGDVLTFTGDFTPVVLIDRSRLTLDFTKARVQNLLIRKSRDIKVRGGAYTGVNYAGGVYVFGSQNVAISNISVSGDGTRPGVTFRESSNVSLQDAVIDRPSLGVNVMKTTGGVIRDTKITRTAVDGMNIASSHQILVEHLECRDNMLLDDHHPDCVQLWSIAGEKPTSDITIRHSAVYGNTQGFSGFDQKEGGFDRIIMENNLVVTGYGPQGVALYNARGSTVRNNRTETLPGARWQTRVNIVRSPDTVVCGNVAAAGAGQSTVKDKPCK